MNQLTRQETTKIVLPKEMSKDAMSAQINTMVEKFNEGDVDPMLYYQQLDFWIKTLTEVKSKIKSPFLNEVRKYGNAFTANNVKVSVRNGARRYTYSHSKLWNSLKERIAKVEIGLRNASPDTPFRDEELNEETGEVVYSYISYPAPSTQNDESVTFQYQ